MWVVSLTHPCLLCFLWGIFLTYPMLAFSGFFLMWDPRLALFLSGKFLLHIPVWLHFIWGVYLTRPMLVSFLIWGICLIHLMHVSFFFLFFNFFYLGSFSYTYSAGFFTFYFLFGELLWYTVFSEEKRTTLNKILK